VQLLRAGLGGREMPGLFAEGVTTMPQNAASHRPFATSSSTPVYRMDIT
jgi:hypothetical protein